METFDHLAVTDLPVSVPVASALRAGGVATVGELRRLTPGQVAAIDGLPQSGVAEVRAALMSCGLDLDLLGDAPAAAEAPVAARTRNGDGRWSRLRFGASCAGISVVVALALEELIDVW